MCKEDCEEIRKEISLTKESISKIEAELDRLRPARVHERRVTELMKELNAYDLGLTLQKTKVFYALFKNGVPISGNLRVYPFIEWLERKILILSGAYGSGKVPEKHKADALKLIDACGSFKIDQKNYNKIHRQPKIMVIG